MNTNPKEVAMRRFSLNLTGFGAAATVLMLVVAARGDAPTAPPNAADALKALGATVLVNDGEITSISARGNAKIDDEALKQVAGLKKLTSLHLAKTPITDAGLAHLTALTALT